MGFDHDFTTHLGLAESLWYRWNHFELYVAGSDSLIMITILPILSSTRRGWRASSCIPSVVMPPAAYKFRPCHLSSPRRGEGFCGTSTYSLHPSLCANSFISPSAINSSFCDALCTLFVSPLMCFHPTYSAMYPTILFCHVSYQTKERLDSCIFC